MNKPYDFPDASGHFGPYGGTFVSETLVHALDELKSVYAQYQNDPEFLAEFEHELKHFVGRPSPVYHAKRWSEQVGGAQIYFKREDLNHTGAHKVNNCIGQAMLAKRMGKPRVIAETGAGQHGVATATVAARYGMKCVVYMGQEDVARQAQNVFRMKLLGAEVVPGVHEAELRHLMRSEWATCADDVLWRRSKLGLHLTPSQREAVAHWFAHQRPLALGGAVSSAMFPASNAAAPHTIHEDLPA